MGDARGSAGDEDVALRVDLRHFLVRCGIARPTPEREGLGPNARDALTGLSDRRTFHAALREEARRLAARGGCSGLLLLDLDNMKSVNDRHGHAAGDAVLVEVGRRIRSAVRENDLVSRIGGDEFGVLARSAVTDRQLDELAARIRSTIASSPIAAGDALALLTATTGATVITATTDPDEALVLADERMYLAKGTAGADAFDRVSELIVGLLDAGQLGLEAAFASGVAEVATARLAFVDSGTGQSWWPSEPDQETQETVRLMAGEARERDEIVEGASDAEGWRLAVPLRGDGEQLGAFVVERAAAFAKADRIALARAGLGLGQALLRLHESVTARRRIAELELLAFRDENTGLANRRALLAELQRLDALGGELALLFVDFDGLREVNNRRSYERGNDLIRAVADAIEGSLAPGELAARLNGSGGDEFIVVCPGLDDAAARERSNSLEECLTTLALPDDIAPLYSGASVGYAVRRQGERPLAFVERAAERMRERKRSRKAAVKNP